MKVVKVGESGKVKVINIGESVSLGKVVNLLVLSPSRFLSHSSCLTFFTIRTIHATGFSKTFQKILYGNSP